MNQRQSDKKLIQLINLFAFLVAGIVLLVLPSLYFVANYKQALGAVDALSKIHGSLVTRAINKNPAMWRFEEHKLMALVEDRTGNSAQDTIYSILDKDRKLIVASADHPLPWGKISKEVVLYDATEPVGFFRVERALPHLMYETLFVALGAFILAAIILIPLRLLPLRALRQSQQRLVHMAHHDALTGLPNRALLDDRLQQAILYAEKYGGTVTLIFIDLDNFKTINDSLGHDVGDELLKRLAERMQRVVSKMDTVVRLGGDEFVIVLCDQPERTESLTGILQKLRDCIAEPLSINRHVLRITGSMGLASYPNDGCDVHTLLKNADAAMYRAKELGRNNFQFYTDEMNNTLQERISLQQGLLNALSNQEFMLVYQPQIDLKSGEIVGVETLLRWKHPKLGLISPAKFIPLAEETGLIVAIGQWVLLTACKQNKAWQKMGMPPIKISVNVSARQFKEKDWVATVAAALQESKLSPCYLELEITESLIMENVERAVETMHQLQAVGVQLSIDDFGTGYSSLSALKHFPVARLKIDQSFIRSLPGNDDDRSIAMAVIALAHRMNLKVVAEGVETEQQQTFLRENECDEMQGFYFSKPVSAQEIVHLFRQDFPLAAEASVV